MPKCPICSADGVDLVVIFYCSNEACQNYHKEEMPPPAEKNEAEADNATDELDSEFDHFGGIWDLYGDS